jgi:diacylglycerol kinase (ATP)
MKHLFIVNPAAGKRDRTAEVSAKAAEMFSQKDDEYEIYVTRGPMDAPEKIKRAADETKELRVYSCGGDGTYNECVCGAAGLSNVAVTPYATGTGNDFIRMFGADMALFRDMDALVSGTVHPMDVIDCNGRICANIASVGFDARVGTDVHKYSGMPVIGGPTGYVASLAVNFVKGLHCHMRISGCGAERDGEYTMVCVCNGRYYGGGFNPVPEADPCDGMMDILVVGEVPRYKALGMVLAYSKGRYRDMPEYITPLRGREIDISFDRESVVNIDGEAIYGRDIHIKLIPGGVNFIAPRGMTFFDGKNS